MNIDKIRRMCRERGLSITKLEAATGLANGTVCKWDGTNPRVSNVKKVADYFGVTIDELIKDE